MNTNQNHHTSQTNIPTTKKQKKIKCPIQLHVDYKNDELIFSWDCSRTKNPEGTYSRIIIIIDYSKYQSFQQIFSIIDSVYNKLKLGDFIKVFFSKTSFNKDWIQKTSEKLKPSEFQQGYIQCQQLDFLQQACKKSFRLSKKYNEQFVSISLFSKQAKLTIQQIVQLVNLKKKYRFHYIFNIFLQGDQISLTKQWVIRGIDIYIYGSRHRFQQYLKSFFYYKSKIRAVNAEIKLSCLNGDMFMKKSNVLQNEWYIDQGKIIKQFYIINNYTKYYSALSINSLKLSKLEFEVEFTITLVGLNKFRMNQKFCFNANNTSQKFQDIKQTFLQQPKFIYYSEVPNCLTIESTRIKRVLIQQKTQKHLILSYQQEFFKL